LAKAAMHSACFELERVWDRFFESHDKTIRVSPLVLLAKSKPVKKITPTVMGTKTWGGLSDVLKVMDPLVYEFEELWKRDLSEKINDSIKQMNSDYEKCSKKITDIIERYNEETGSDLDSFRILTAGPFGLVYFLPPPRFFIGGAILVEIPMEKWISFPYTSTSVYRIAVAMKPYLQLCNNALAKYAEENLTDSLQRASQRIVEATKAEFEQSLKE